MKSKKSYLLWDSSFSLSLQMAGYFVFVLLLLFAAFAPAGTVTSFLVEVFSFFALASCASLSEGAVLFFFTGWLVEF
jgi:hypothetical protein